MSRPPHDAVTQPPGRPVSSRSWRGVACSGGAEERYETAQFEELQKNLAHARELYEKPVPPSPAEGRRLHHADELLGREVLERGACAS